MCCCREIRGDCGAAQSVLAFYHMIPALQPSIFFSSFIIPRRFPQDIQRFVSRHDFCRSMIILLRSHTANSVRRRSTFLLPPFEVAQRRVVLRSNDDFIHLQAPEQTKIILRDETFAYPGGNGISDPHSYDNRRLDLHYGYAHHSVKKCYPPILA